MERPKIKLVIWILLCETFHCVITEDSCTSSICATVSQNYVIVGETEEVKISCFVTQRDGDSFIFRTPDNKDCMYDCFPATAPECQFMTNIKSCFCDNIEVNGYCQPSVKNVTFVTDVITMDYIGTWQCRDGSRGTPAEFALEKQECVTHLEVLGPNKTIEDNIYQYTCIAPNGAPPADIYWFLDEADVTLSAENTSSPGDGNTVTVTSKLNYTANKNDSGLYLKCEAHQLGENVIEKSELLDVLYTTDTQLLVNSKRFTTYEIIENNTITLQCDITDGNPKDGLLYIFYKSPESDILQQGINDTYVCENVKSTDGGSFYCEADNSLGLGDGVKSDINVLYPPRIVLLPNSVLNESENSPVFFTCNVTSNPISTITWTKDDGKPIESSNGNVSFDKVSRDDAGMYMCNATNVMVPTDDEAQHGSDVQGLTLHVRYSASVEIGPCQHHLVVLKGRKVVLYCHVLDAYPNTTSFIWKYDNELVSVETDYYEVSVDIQPDHDGNYSCKGVNGESGALASSVILEVQYHPSEENMNITGETTLLEGETLSLLCASSAVPNAAYKWKHPGGKNEDGSLLKIGNIDKRQAGTYTCEATNTINTCTEGIKTDNGAKSVDIDIWFPPEWTASKNTTEAEFEAVNFTLQCLVTANPEPHRFQWYFQDQAISSATEQNYTLSIVNANDFGIYKCEVENEVSNKTFPIELLESGDISGGGIPDGGISGGAIAGIVIFVLAFIVVAVGLLYIKTDVFSRSKDGHEQLNNSRDFDTLGHDNGAYADAEGIGVSGTSGAVYAQVDKKKKKKGKKNKDEPGESEVIPMYAEVNKGNKKKKKDGSVAEGMPVYAEVNKDKKKKKKDATVPAEGIPVYAEVNKDKKKKKKAPVPTEVAALYAEVNKGATSRTDPGETPYEDVNTKPNKPPISAKPKIASDSTRQTSEEGCVYIQVDFPKYKDKGKKGVIHGKENMTVYAQIDWTRKADPVEDDPPPYREDEDVMGELPPARNGDE